MIRKPRRKIEEVFLKPQGPLSANGLLKMPRDGWESLRASITDHRNGGDGSIAFCAACGGRVFIRVSHGRPLFAHYKGADLSCPWYTGENMRPNDARAAQYRGQQESEMHRRMCNLIAELAALDERFEGAKVDKYLAPTENRTGRYPDVLVKWRGFKRLAVEYQQSHTFQTEVSQRCIHYDREGIPLLWVLSSFNPEKVPQAVSDVVLRHRGNAFVLDQRAIAESREQGTLVLNCYLWNGTGYDFPVLTRFDALTFPKKGLPFFEDRKIKPLLEDIRQIRVPYFEALRVRRNPAGDLRVDGLEQFPDRWAIERLIATAFSIAAEAAGKPENFWCNSKNIVGMLNSYLNSNSGAPCARLLTELIKNTSQKALLTGTVGTHLRRAMERQNKQVSDTSQEWKLLRELLPEALDPYTRQRLEEAGELPAWASCELDG